MRKHNMTLVLATFCCLLLGACSGSGDSDDSDEPEIQPSPPITITSVEAELAGVIDSENLTRPLVLMLQTFSGEQFIHSINGANINTSFHSASSSKWVLASVALKLVDENLVTLNDTPQMHIEFWPTTGPLSNITLQQLLSMTSGLNNEPFCLNRIIETLEDCVEQILVDNANMSEQDKTFYYGPAHMQVAGLMLINAGEFDNWAETFDYFNAITGAFDLSVFDRPSSSNPRLAGGMSVNAAEYMNFLSKIADNSLLSSSLNEEMFSSQTSDLEMTYSPAQDTLGKNWQYGLGVWIECELSSLQCSEQGRFSSPGSFGLYPFIDTQNQVFGIIAQEGPLGTFEEAFLLYERLNPLVLQWGTLANN